jgi:penicillin amidase
MGDMVDQLRAGAAATMFPEEGELVCPGLAERAEVLRDRWGVPYLSAATLEDLWFAQGVVTAGERLFQLDLLLRAAGGRLSEVFADRTLPDDRFARTVGFNRAGARLAAGWDEPSRRMHERFRSGVFAWIERMPGPPIEYQLLDLTPDLPADEAAWAAGFVYLSWSLSGNWDVELLRAWIAERAGPEAVAALLPPAPDGPPSTTAGGLHGRLLDGAPRTRGQGSNNWAVSGSKTHTGRPLLANDPHLLAIQPGPWIELHLRAPGYEARGVALTFSPGVLLGTTAHHAWGVTNVSGDVQDLYLERLNDDRTAAEYEGTWEPLTVHREAITVRGSEEPVTLEVGETRHGPVLDAYLVGVLQPEVIQLPSADTYALRWTGLERGLRPSSALDVARARSFQEFRHAVAGVESPGQNFVYADVDGTIGYQCSGVYPIRRRGDGSVPVPGWTGVHEWDGFVPFDELPWAENPSSGFLVTANNRIHGPDYPHLIGRDFHPPFRARRIVELLEGSDRHTVESLARIQRDTVSLVARELLPFLAGIEGRTDRERETLALVGNWDGDMAADSVAAAVFNVWCAHLARRLLEPVLGADLLRAYHARREPFQCLALPTLLRDPRSISAERQDLDPEEFLEEVKHGALEDAIAELEARIGLDPAAWRWGSLHRLRLVHPLGSIPGLGPLFTAVDAELGGDEQTVAQAGFDGRDGYPAAVIPSWRAIYDLADLDRSAGVLPAGISGNPGSPHWNDQATLWLAGEYHPLPFTRPAVEAAAVATLRLVPG